MLSLLIALATIQETPAAAAAPARSLKDVPGIAITYHDLADKDVQNIIKTLKKRKPLTPAQQKMLAASTNWGISPSVVRTTKGTVCTVTKAQIEFTPKADLPRFNEASVPATDQGEWRSYLAAIEAQAAAKLWFAYDRLPTFEQAVVGKPCDQAIADGMAAVAKLKADAAAFQPPVSAGVSASTSAAPGTAKGGRVSGAGLPDSPDSYGRSPTGSAERP
jgi:hypothetical protein